MLWIILLMMLLLKMLLSVRNHKLNRTNNHNLCLHYLQSVFQKPFFNGNFQSMLYVPLPNVPISKIKIHKDANQWFLFVEATKE